MGVQGQKFPKNNVVDNIKTPGDRKPVLGVHINELVDELTDGTSEDFKVASLATDAITETTAGNGVVVDGVTIKDGAVTSTGVNSAVGGTTISTNVVEYTTEVTLSTTEIVGTSAGSLGHADGAILVAAAGAGTALQFVNAVLVYDYDTAAYTGGAGDDLVVNIGSGGAQVSVSGAIATADLITKAGDTVINLSSLTNDYVMAVNSPINMTATEVTQPGTAAGGIRVLVTYRVVTTNL